MDMGTIFNFILLPAVLSLALASFLFPRYFPLTKLIKNDKMRDIVHGCLYVVTIALMLYILNNKFV